MSTTATKRTWREALADGEAFRAMFDGCYERWEIAGSTRRHRAEVGDVEHVIIPAFGNVADESNLFAPPVRTNLLWHRLDARIRDATISDPAGEGHRQAMRDCKAFELSAARAGLLRKHIYGAAGYRWGEKYRGVDFRGFNHEMFTADADNWGSVLLIRTGPAEFSKSAVIALRKHSLRNMDGYVWRCDPCDECRIAAREKCTDCNGTRLKPIEKLSVRGEAEFFALCGMKYVEPEMRR